MVNRPWRTITVACFAVLLVAQGYYSFAVKPEPYPTIRMPNFGTAAAADGTFVITIARAEVVSGDGSVQSISPTELMEEFRFSTARPSYDYLFNSADPGQVTEPVRSWLRGRIEALGKGSDPVEMRMCWQRSAIRIADASPASATPCTWKVVAL